MSSSAAVSTSTAGTLTVIASVQDPGPIPVVRGMDPDPSAIKQK